MMNYKIPFNKPFTTGNELEYIHQAIANGKISGDGIFTKRCQEYFEKRYGFKKCLLTSSCTDALEMCAILADIQSGDEVIIPSYTFVSTANAFLLRGAKIVFADSRKDHPGIDEDSIEELITPRTRVIVPVHYAGVACDMEKIMDLADKYNLLVVEDAALSLDSYYTFSNGIKKPLGSIGHLSTFSFHETKNITSGEGGMLVINDQRYINRAEIIREKGTNRSSFFRGEIDKYSWVDIGSSFLPSEITAAFLFAQLERMDDIQARRIEIWNLYNDAFEKPENTGKVLRATIPPYSSNNANSFYLLCKDSNIRSAIIGHLKSKFIHATFHYQCLHRSSYHLQSGNHITLTNADRYTDQLLRLPLFYDLTNDQISEIVSECMIFFYSD